MNKQIEEMAKVISESDILCNDCGQYGNTYCAEAIAKTLTELGYRKQIDGEWEFVEGTMFMKASYRCTNCGYRIVVPAKEPNYCSECGAHMKKRD